LRGDPEDANALYGRGLAKQLAGDDVGAFQGIAAAKSKAPAVVDYFTQLGLSALR
jgi:hypothetical protein